MVQIIDENRKPSTSERFSQAFGQGIDAFSQYMGARKQKELESHAIETGKQLFGIDTTGFGPEERKALFVESLKQQGKQGRLGQTQDFLGQLFKGKEGESAPEGAPNKNQFDPTELSDDDIAQATALDPNLGRSLQHAKDVGLREKRENKKFEFEKEKLSRKEHGEISKPVLIELNQSRKNIPLQEQAIADIQEAAPNVSALDYFADVTGFEPARSAQGAKLKTAIKDFFLSDLTRVGARPNQWIEQQLADALPKIGRSKEANLITAEGMKFKLDLAKKRIEEIDALAEKDREKFGYVKGDIDSRALNNMKKYVIDRQKELKDNIKKIKLENKNENKTVKMKSPDGSIYEILSEDIDEAIENGFDHVK